MDFAQLKEEYRQFLTDNGYEKNTVQTSCSDAFYFYKYTNEIDFCELTKPETNIDDYKNTLFNIVRKHSKGDSTKNISGYLYQLKLLRKFIATKEGKIEIIKAVPIIKLNNLKTSRTQNVPTPCLVEVKKYLSLWDELGNYHLQEKH